MKGGSEDKLDERYEHVSNSGEKVKVRYEFLHCQRMLQL
jgi:hypothetical protein